MVSTRMIRSLIYKFVLVGLFTAAAFAQKAPRETFKAPAEIDQALRARVAEFFQLHVDGNFRKAYTMVAEDTQDYYFGALKMKFESFKITGVRFLNDNFTKASVDLECTQKMQRMEFGGVVVPIPMTTLWKIENNQWVWFRDPDNQELTPMGLSDLGKMRDGEKVSQALKGLTDPTQLQQKAGEILKQSGIDKPEVTLASDKASVAEVNFHNGWPGFIQVALDPGAELAGFTAKLDKQDLNSNENAVLKLSYSPMANGAGLVKVPTQARVRLIVQPFNLVYPVTVKFAPSTN